MKNLNNIIFNAEDSPLYEPTYKYDWDRIFHRTELFIFNVLLDITYKYKTIWITDEI
jgi:hypothetical protein